MLTHTLLLAAAATLPFTLALPTAQGTNPDPTSTTTSPKTTHTVVAGRPGLRFDPENIVASPGSIIEFHFLPANHSVVESSFAEPCVPKDDSNESFFSGFFPVSPNPDGSVAQSGEVFQIEVRDDKPIWFYCAQGRHCQGGMVGVVNQDFDGGNTLEAHRRLAAQVEGPAGVKGVVQGGWRGENPNPLGGF